MARQRALRAKILLRLDDANAEELRPEAIDGHSSGERIVGADQPPRQTKAVRRRVVWKQMKGRGHPRLDRLAGIEEIPLVQQMRLAPFVGRQFAHYRQGHRLDVVELPAQFPQSLVQGSQ